MGAGELLVVGEGLSALHETSVSEQGGLFPEAELFVNLLWFFSVPPAKRVVIRAAGEHEAPDVPLRRRLRRDMPLLCGD